MTPAQLREIEAWLAQTDAAIAQIDAGTVAALLATYAAIDDWEDPRQTIAAATAAVATAAAGRQTAAELSSQSTLLVASVLRGSTVRSTATTQAAYPRNADPFDVYSRPIFVYRAALANGLDEHQAQAQAFERARMLAQTDNLLTRRNAALTQTAGIGATKYRRRIHPEMSKTGTCGLCIAAASRIYNRGDLMPIHTRCKCEVIPILGADDPGEALNLADMERLYAATPGTTRSELVKTRYRVEDDSELGPLLIPAA